MLLWLGTVATLAFSPSAPVALPHTSAVRRVAAPSLPHTSAVRRVDSPSMVVLPLLNGGEIVLPDDAGAYAIGAGLVLGGLFWRKVFHDAGIFVHKSKAPSAHELERVEKLSKFGWLQADMRVPLPSLADLEVACHRVGTSMGRDVYLCAEPSNAPRASCAVSAQFSEHYDRDVYICDALGA